MRKHLSYLLSAISVVFAAPSCIEETLPEENVNLTGMIFTAQNEGLLMQGTKTALSHDLTAHWIDGDAIGVFSASDNNVKCILVSAEEGKFSGAGVKGEGPYYVVYPYASDNIFDGSLLTAEVPQVQTVSAGQCVASGALVTACESSTTTLMFRNCVALMRLEIPRSDIKQVKIEATGENEYLTGKFTMDLSDDVLMPTIMEGETASASVILKADKGALSSGIYYAAVLPTSLSGIKITFTNTADEEIEVSKESPITLERSNGISFGSFFTYEISTAEELLKWSSQSAKFTSWDVANLMNDIDMSGVASQYIEAVDFKGTFNGNGYTISGLKTPLFANLYGSVNNLTLNSSINYKGKNDNMPGHNQAVGILAHIAYVTEHSDAQISKVTTNGSLSVNRTTAFDKYFVAGGLLGSSNGVKIEDCENYATVKVASMTLTGTSSRLCAGGIVGQITSSLTSVIRCSNYGNVTISESCSSEAQSIVGGIAGYVSTDGLFTSCANSGSITNSAKSASGYFTAGIIGTIGTVANANGSSTKAWEYGNINGCSNSGIILDNSEYSTAVSHWLGGIIALANVNNITFDSCSNYGTVTLDVSKCNIANAGGLFGQVYQSVESVIKKCNNFSGATVSINNAECATIYEGGIVGFTNNKQITLLNCVNRAEIVNTGTASASIRIGGVAGFTGKGAILGSEGNTDFCSNYGTIVCSSAQQEQTSIGGIVGQSSSVAISVYGARSYGDISFSSTAQVKLLYVGGIGGIFGTSPSVIGCLSNCNITNNSSADKSYGSAIIAGSSSSKIKIHGCRIAGTVFGTEINENNVNDYLCIYYSNANATKDFQDNSCLFGSAEDLIPEEESLCVGTYNILSSKSRDSYNTWDAAKWTISTNINIMSCDIMTLNELETDEIQYIRQQFPQMTLVEFPNSNNNQYNNTSGILFNPNRLTILDEGIYWLSNPNTSKLITEPDAYYYIDWQNFTKYEASIARACVWGKFQDKKTSEIFYFFSSHPHHRGDDQQSSKFNTVNSLNCGNIRSLLKQISIINTENLPYVVAGDMNTESSYLSYNLFAEAGLISAFDEARETGVIDNQTDKTPATCPGTNPEAYKTSEAYRLDHIFHNGFETKSYTNIFTKYTNAEDGQKYYPSDHLPVKVILEYD